MSDNLRMNPGAAGDLAATDEVTNSGDLAHVQLVRVVGVTGAEGSKTVADSDEVVSLGKPADAAASSDTGTFGLIALTKRELQSLTTLLARTPQMGFQAASASSPIVVSNDLTVLSTAVQSAINQDLFTESVNGWYDARAFHSASLHIIGGAGISAGAVFFEQTNDPTNAPAGRPWLLQEHDVLNSNPIGAAVTIAANTQRIFEGAITAGYIRARVSTAFTGGTIRLAAVLSQLPYQSTRFNLQQATAANLAMTATLASTTITSISAGTNAIGDVGVQYRANATGAASGAHIVSAATTNATIVKASAGRVLGWSLANTTAAWKYVKLHNQTTAPTAGAGVVRTIAIPPNGSREMNMGGGIAFTTGIGLTITNAAADNDATAVAVGDVVGDLFFA